MPGTSTTPASGPPTSMQGASYADMHGIDRKYIAVLTVSGEGGMSYTFETSVEETLSLSIGAQWAAPFENVLSEAAQTAGSKNASVGKAMGWGSLAMKGMGLSGKAKITSVQVWQSSDPFAVTIPFTFIAVNSAKTDVLDKVKALLKMVAPSETAGTLLVAPGPTLLGAAIGGVNINLKIGEYLELEPCIIDDVQVQFDNVIGEEGIPLRAKVTVSIKSWYNAFTKEDIDKMIKK